MNAITSPLNFASAYRQLRPAQKLYVDGYVADVEREAAQRNERVSLALHRPIPLDVIKASRGMLDIPLVRAAIAERINEIATASELSVGRVLKEITAVALSSVANYIEIDDNGIPHIDLSKCTPEALSAIKSIKYETKGGDLEKPSSVKVEFTLHDKLAALKMVGDYMGLYNPDNPYWRSENAKPVERAGLPATLTVEEAGEIYAQMING